MTRPAVIDSPSNPRIRSAAALRERRQRDRAGRILIDGARELLRALDAGVAVESVYVCESLCRSHECREVVRSFPEDDPRVVRVSEAAFGRVAFGDRTEGVVGVAVRPSLELAALRITSAEPLIGIVESLEKPGNLGAILRSADGAGLDALLAADPRTDLYNPNAIRASIGTVFSVPVAAASSDAVLAWLRERAVRIVVARVDAPTLYSEADLRGPVGLVLGSEAEGVTGAWTGPDVMTVRLPMLGVADSLNVAAAAAVLFYEARRQRGIPAEPAATRRS